MAEETAQVLPGTDSGHHEQNVRTEMVKQLGPTFDAGYTTPVLDQSAVDSTLTEGPETAGQELWENTFKYVGAGRIADSGKLLDVFKKRLGMMFPGSSIVEEEKKK